METQKYFLGDAEMTITYGEFSGIPSDCAGKMQWSATYDSVDLSEILTFDYAARTIKLA